VKKVAKNPPSEARAVILKPGKDKPVRNRHHWIFSGAVAKLPEFDDGDVLPVLAGNGDHLGYGYFNRRCSIIGRMLSFDRTPALEAVRAGIERATALRRALFTEATNAYRLVNAEGDGLPGLIVDRYGGVLVLQVATLGMERLKPFVLECLRRVSPSRAVYEKSNLAARREEGLEDREALLEGELPAEVRILENRYPFVVDIIHSQKTGFFLDQREMRQLVMFFSRGRSILNAFSYTGAFSVYALHGGAARVVSVDVSEPALELARQNVSLNGFPPRNEDFIKADVFEFLRKERADRYDLIILDPPAFAKKKADVVQACRGYKDLNRLALSKLPAGGLLLTFSCSHFVNEALFQTVLFQAALEAGRRVRILQRHHLSFDHPLNICHPESEYLKGFLLYVD
jgi:23S rRNA (cytosine1962-C5)-methyltransferase